MSILNTLNSEFNIKVENGVAYDMQDKGNILATNQKGLIEFYIDCYKLKMEHVLSGETETKAHYQNIIEQLETLQKG